MAQRPTTQIFVGGKRNHVPATGPRKFMGQPRETHFETHVVPPSKRQALPPAAPPPSGAPKPAPAAVAVKTIRSPIGGDPWTKNYKKVYEIMDFDGNATVAERDGCLVLIREFASSDQRAVQLYLQLQHRNIVEVVEAFSSKDSHYIVMEEMALCLYHLVRCPIYPSDLQLRSLLFQAANGLEFLHDADLGYGGFRCQNMLVNPRGIVKWANQEKLKLITPEIKKCDAASLGEVALYLMQKNPGPGVEDIDKWAEFLSFVASASTVRTVAEFRKDPILAKMPPRHEKSLVALVCIAEVTSLREIEYKTFEEPSR